MKPQENFYWLGIILLLYSVKNYSYSEVYYFIIGVVSLIVSYLISYEVLK